MNLVEGVQEEIKRVTAIIQEYSKYEGGQLAKKAWRSGGIIPTKADLNY